MKNNVLIVHEPKRGVGYFLLELDMRNGGARIPMGWADGQDKIEVVAKNNNASILQVQ